MLINNLFIYKQNELTNNFIKLSDFTTTVNNVLAIERCQLFFKIRTDKHIKKIYIYQNIDKEILISLVDTLVNISNLSRNFCNKVLKYCCFDLEDSLNIITNLSESDIENINYINILDDEYYEVKVASFYNYFILNKGLINLIESTDRRFFRLFIDHQNNERHKSFKIYVNVFIDKDYLSHIYNHSDITTFLYGLYRYNMCCSLGEELPEIKLKNKYSKSILKISKRPYFDYQVLNIKWMLDLENEIDKGLDFSTYLLTSFIYSLKIGETDNYLLFNSKRDLINPLNLEQIHFKPLGGVLCDDIGLGKSCSMIGLLNEKAIKDKYPSLIICPSRLCSQWANEIEKTCYLTYKIVSTITQFRQLQKCNRKDYTIIILSYSFLINENYLKLKEEKPETETFIENSKWERIILDEGHEYLSLKKQKRQHFYLIKRELDKIKSKYRWICSGTPYTTQDDLFEVIKFICPNIHSSIIKKNISYYFNILVYHLFRKNKKEHNKHVIRIPEPIITTKFLYQSDIEKAIYESSLGDKTKMIQLCSHILVSEEHVNILGNKPLSLDMVYKKMLDYFSSKIEKWNKHIKNCSTIISKMKITNDKLEHYKLKLENYHKELKENEMKLKIFKNLDETKISNSECPICFIDLNHQMKSIFPCTHIYCIACTRILFENKQEVCCPCCRATILKDNFEVIESGEDNYIDNINQWGTKMCYLISYLGEILKDKSNRIILFSQWDNLLKLVSKVLEEKNISYLFINGSVNVIHSKIKKFKTNEDIRLVLLSSDKSVSGLNLTEANHIILLDTINNDKETSKVIEEQAIGRAVRIGQQRQVNVKRLIMNNTIEYDYYVQNIMN